MDESLIEKFPSSCDNGNFLDQAIYGVAVAVGVAVSVGVGVADGAATVFVTVGDAGAVVTVGVAVAAGAAEAL